MAKLSRVLLKIFGGEGVENDFSKFGSEAASDPIKTRNLSVMQSLGAWMTGWADAIIGGSKNLPALEDMNTVMYVHSYMTAYLLEAGIPEWEVGTTYFIGCIVRRPGTHELYCSLVDDNLANALPSQIDDANWQYLALAPANGWTPFVGSVTRASANSINVPAGAASRHKVGDSIKIVQPTLGTKYFSITAVADTLLTLTGGDDYSVANEAISSASFSRGKPIDFPEWFNHNPAMVASQTMTFENPTIRVSKFRIIGKACEFLMKVTAQTAAAPDTGPKAVLPVTPDLAASQYIQPAAVSSDGSNISAATVEIAGTWAIFRKYDNSNWTIGAGRMCSMHIVYGI